MDPESEHQALACEPGSGNVRLITLPTPKLGQEEILVEIKFAGVCGTDLDILRGARADAPGILGHESVGHILTSKIPDDRYAPGCSVIFNPVSASDQRVILGHTFPGIWQTRRVITSQEMKNGHVVAFELRVPQPLGVLIEPLATVLYGLNLVQELAGKGSIAVLGAGAIGTLFAIEARRRGFHTVLLLGPSQNRLEWAVDRSIVSHKEAVLVDRNSARGRVLKGCAWIGDTVDATIVCTPRHAASIALRTAAAITRSNGVLDLVGGISDDYRSDIFPDIELNAVRRGNVRGQPIPGVYRDVITSDGKPLRLTGHRGTSPEQLLNAAYLLAADTHLYSRVITHVVPLKRAPELLTRWVHSNERKLAQQHVVKLVLDLTNSVDDVTAYQI